MWSWVLDFNPEFEFGSAPASPAPPLTSSVTVLLIDGLRLDASRSMPALNALRARGADIEGRTGTPSFSRPGRATLAVGTPPDVHGVTTNRQRRSLTVDNLFRRVGDLGGVCRVAGSAIWPGLFGDDIARCGSFRRNESKEGPGAFEDQVGAVREAQEKGLEFILGQRAMLRIADILSTDFAAHEFGAASPRYRAEYLRVDGDLARVSSRLDLTKETLIVTADHGHRDAGGHGGDEPEVLAIPIVMTGAGIKASSRASASASDIAPTIAALLGLPLPAGGSGRPLVSVLAADESKLDEIKKAVDLQSRAFLGVAAERFGQSDPGEGPRDFWALRGGYRDTETSRRIPAALLLALAMGLGVLAATWRAHADIAAVASGLVAAALLSFVTVRFVLPPLSFSAINYDEMLVPYFLSIVQASAATAVMTLAAAALAAHIRPKGRNASPAAAIGATGLLVSAMLLLAVVARWRYDGLLLPLALPPPGRLVEAFALILAAAAVALTSLVAMEVAGAMEARPKGR